MIRNVLTALALLPALVLAAACGEQDGAASSRASGAEPGAVAPAGSSVASAQKHPAIDAAADALPRSGNGLGLFVRRPETSRYEFIPWKSEATFNSIVSTFRNKPGGHVHFAPGEYVITQRLAIHVIPQLRVSGSPKTRLIFSEGPFIVSHNSRRIEVGDTELYVDRTEDFRAGGRYQLYLANGKGDRQLEIQVTEVLEDRLKLQRPVRFMQHVKGIDAGCKIHEELNFFHVLKSPGLVIENIEMDGANRWGIRGHTIYCGIYVSGMHHGDERPDVRGLHVHSCTFKNLAGRGVVFYGMDDAVIENNYFQNIRAQAMEIDHISSGTIRGNYVDGAEVGAMVNDAFESIVESNVFVNCRDGVKFLKVYRQDWVNKGNTIRDNRIGPGCTTGVNFFNKGMTENLITGNTFIGLPDGKRVVRGEGNTIELR